MNDKPRTGRILRDLREVAEEERQRKAKHDKWVEDMRDNGCTDPEDPVELARWQAEQDKKYEQFKEDRREIEALFGMDREELQRIKDSRPLGVPPPIEPRSIHSSVPQPPWKRKLRP
ncbi:MULTISPECIES: hypothetical protein [Bradyrhizobium]|jgi:hypothetical protein|uniref:hypothetical protein n=1 Tax=Bradyrhizobium TaxID=374 RepID=UPI0004569856|nr:hypothetical protein [Bradyrhizobium japonicum]AHY53330.1 hypothetical protein BJS_00708 [Bradyrhizobium japonicum SEMIA 5079]MCD9111096.1 hypothetical protein [Bradyrhizobium japonicum]MCD9256525.1 hypothetical protein [Bradyrhizobium japonicum SEMIA 5079]MCD9823973.1 hypothetical protein [Bradyrhizobium japonicum]MCD9896268.1 hypothetical protein [Bradyrhizobium japonicum]